MCEVHTIVTNERVDPYNYDPTRTTTLRNAFSRAMRRRFDELIKVIRISVVTQDALGLSEERQNTPFTFQMNPASPGQFDFPRSADKIDAFMRWLEEQVERGILTTGTYSQLGSAFDQAWTNLYILDSYKRGIIRANREMRKLGFNIPSIEDQGGIDVVMQNPIHMDRVALLFTRVYEGLKGITTAMDTQISRVLAQGMIDGDNMQTIARKLIATINGTGMGDLAITDTLGRFIPARRRAEMLARTEIIRAHHLATIQEYRNWQMVGVYVKAEWMTAGDNRVCSQCAGMQGEIFKLDVIEKMIPLHPQCRCIALPYRTNEKIQIKQPL